MYVQWLVAVATEIQGNARKAQSCSRFTSEIEQEFRQKLNIGRMKCIIFKTITRILNEFFFKKWVSEGRFHSLLAKTLVHKRHTSCALLDSVMSKGSGVTRSSY